VAEWLRNGLQNRRPRRYPATRLTGPFV